MAIITEAIVGLLAAVLQALPAVFAVLLFIVAASINLVFWLVSPRIREKKRQEWAGKPRRKYLELGVGGVSLVSLLGLVVWLNWSAAKPAAAKVLLVEGGKGEDVRIRIKADAVKGASNDILLAVKKGGARKILETDSLKELGKEVQENIVVLGSVGNEPRAQGTNSKSSPASSGITSEK